MFIFIFHVLKPENRRISDFKLTTVAFQGGSYEFFSFSIFFRMSAYGFVVMINY